MTGISRLLAFGLQLSVYRALGCSDPYSRIEGVCLLSSADSKNWCDAQAYCSSKGGELVRGNTFLALSGKNVSSLPLRYWIGLTDFKVERNTDKSGWQWSDGSLEPSSSTIVWDTGKPSKAHTDCVYVCVSGKTCNQVCYISYYPAVCQPRSEPSSNARAAEFQMLSIPAGLSTDDYALGECSQLLHNVVSEIECAALCSGENKGQCASFYFNKERRECLLLLYTDATVKLTDGQSWQKFIMKK